MKTGWHLRSLIVLGLAFGLLALFLRNVDLGRVATDIAHARLGWLAVTLATMFVNLAVRALRWQYLLEPIGHASFGNAFRATAVGFAASSVLPARAGEFIRPWFLSRHEPVSATGAFATIIVERLLDTATVLILLGLFVVLFGGELASANPAAMAGITWAGGLAGAGAVVGLAVLFFLAGSPEWLGRTVSHLERLLPARLAGVLAQVAEKFSQGLGAVRRPGRLLIALAWSFPLWLSIALGIFSVASSFQLGIPFSGAFLLMALLVIGVAVPTPGAVGGFHEAFRFGATTFYGVQNESAVGAALVLHAFSILPSLLLGLWFAAQEGLNLSGMRQLAAHASEEGQPS